MTGARTLAVTIALALLCIAGIIGMLVADGGWDALFFILAALPLVCGVGFMWRGRTRG